MLKLSRWWLARASETLLPLSLSPDIHAALGEWSYTGSCQDYEEPREVCQLCGYAPLRYHFEIENRENHNLLLVGSECIERFEIDGVDQVKADRAEMIRKAKEERTREMIRVILTETGGRLDLMTFWTEHEGISPKQALWAAQVLHRKGYEAPSDFPSVCLRRDKHKTQLRTMTDLERGFLWPYLREDQRVKYVEFGVRDPGPPVKKSR